VKPVFQIGIGWAINHKQKNTHHHHNTYAIMIACTLLWIILKYTNLISRVTGVYIKYLLKDPLNYAFFLLFIRLGKVLKILGPAESGVF